jgi:hypothetical protein
VQEFEQSRGLDERFTKWPSLTVNVLYPFSEARRLFVLISGAVLAPIANTRPNHSPLCPNAFLFPLTAPPTSSSQFTMSQAPSASASTSSSNFQSIFNAALKAYEKKTKKDLLAHPLAAQLQACKSPGDILAVLQDKVNEFDQSRSADERLSQWLNPTINVLYSFSATLGAGVGLVSTVKSTCLLLPLITNFAGILARIRHLLWYWGSPLGERASLIPRCRGDSHYEVCLRRPKMSKPAKMHSSISSSVSRTSSSASSLIPQCRRQTR